MKKIIISLIVMSLFISGCSNNKIDHVSDILSTNLDNCSIEKDSDSHSGFMGDGAYFAKISCSSNIEFDEWKELPLSTEINDALEIEICDDKECKNVFDKYNIPDVENGYYYFVDRHSMASDKKSDVDLNNRSSYNYSIGIYDSDTNILYFYEFDS